MFTLSFNFLIFQCGELDQTIEDHRVTFDSPEALAEAMTVLAAIGTSNVQSLIGEIAQRTRCAHILPITMVKGGINARTCILVQSATRVVPKVPEGLTDIESQQFAMGVAVSANMRTVGVISLNAG